jgi:hypothetical protein
MADAGLLYHSHERRFAGHAVLPGVTSPSARGPLTVQPSSSVTWLSEGTYYGFGCAGGKALKVASQNDGLWNGSPATSRRRLDQSALSPKADR